MLLYRYLPAACRLGAGLILVVCVLGCVPGEPVDEGKAGDVEAATVSEHTLAAVERLARARRAAGEHAFSPEQWIERLRAGEPPPDLRSQIDRRAQLGRALLYAGRTEEAVDEIAAAVVAATAHAELFRPTFLRTLRHLEAISWLRLAEERNCVDGHTIDSCLLPIRDTGVHDDPEGSRRAMALYLRLAEEDPDDLEARWLLNLAAMTLGVWPDEVPEALRVPPSVFAPPREVDGRIARWIDVAPQAGVAVNETAGGVVADDLDGDGRIDLLVSSWGAGDPLRLFLADPDGGFVERTDHAGLGGLDGGLNLVHADIDNDGDLDVLVLRGAWRGRAGRLPNSLLLNRGDGRFDDVTAAAGLLDYHPTQTAAWGDFDRDGWIDLFVGHESVGRDRHPSKLFRGLGPGPERTATGDPIPRFEEVTAAADIAVEGFVKACAWGDFDGDGWPDLYVSRLLESNLLLRNLGDGTFEDVTRAAGVAEPVHSFSIAVLDADQDGDLDLFVSGYPIDYASIDAHDAVADWLGLPTDGARARFYRNRGDGTFDDASAEVGLDRVFYTMGIGVEDVDGDGLPDLYLGTGAPSLGALMPNRLFLGTTSADATHRFIEATTTAGVGHLQKGHGIAFADFDGDGDVDLYAVLGGAYSGDRYPNALFENRSAPPAWLTLRLEGTRSNRAALGARVQIDLESADGTRRSLHRTVSTGGSFGSHSLQIELALRAGEVPEVVHVHWPAGPATESERFELPSAHRVFRLREGDGPAGAIDETLPARSLASASSAVDHEHRH